MDLMDPSATLNHSLEEAASRFPKKGVAVFDGRGRSFERRTYDEMLDGIRLAAGRWVALGVEPGERVVISVPTSWEWLDGWLGAMWLGALPVAVAPGSSLGAAEAQVRKVEGVLERIGARRLLATAGFRSEAERFEARHCLEAQLDPDQFTSVTPVDDPLRPEPRPEDIAFLQLTSGSTGLPRAVMIRHGAAVHNSLASYNGIQRPRHVDDWPRVDSMVSWLPLHHDMGLVGCLFLSLSHGFDLWLLRSNTFLARPRVWLDQLGRHGTVTAPCPNFGLHLCVDRLGEEDRRGLDLSSWRNAMVGAEMVRPETTAAFAEAFADTGFRPDWIRPCYGLAEATLSVTFDERGQGVRTRPMPEDAGAGYDLSDVVCLGEAIIDTEVEIVDPAGGPLAEGVVGEVRIHGPGVFAGYYNDPEATAECLRDGWLATGDLGFVHRGELYLTGRKKEILIIRGHNLMPHEIEWVAESVTGGGGAARSGAFSVAHGSEGEEAVLVVEVKERDPERLAELGREIRSRIGRTLSLPLADLVFVRRGRIPKTTSGKIQRRKLREMYLNGRIDKISAPPI